MGQSQWKTVGRSEQPKPKALPEMDIPAHIQSALRIETPAPTAEELADAVNQWAPAQSAFGLSAEDFAAVASDVENGSELIDVSRLSRPPGDWKYIELVCDGSRDCFGACTPRSGSDVLPPTAVGQAMLKGWFADATILDDNTSISEGILVTGLASGAKNKDFARRLIKTWADASLMLENSSVPPAWVTKSQIVLSGDSRILNPQLLRFNYENLFLEVVSEVKAKWRYLSLYRILEHGYLSEVFDTLKAEFFLSPRESLSKAVDSVESELNQFISLADTGTLKDEFGVFFEGFERVKAVPNRFAAAVDRSIRIGGQLKKFKTSWEHGVLVCYKIRSAIVHAGLSSPIFDAYPDGPDCLNALLPSLESIGLKYLKIVIA
jgi:hypothetical protein